MDYEEGSSAMSTAAASSSKPKPTTSTNKQSNDPASSPFVNCVSPHALVNDPLNLDSSLNFDQPEWNYSLDQTAFNTPPPPPDLCNDIDDDEIMHDDMGPVEPFKPYSQFSSKPSPFREGPVFYNSLLPLTMAPQDAVLNTHEDDDLVFQGLESPKWHVSNYSLPQKPETFDLPEAQDDDDEDDEYDEVLISSSDDEMEDLYTEPSNWSSRVPGLTSFGTQPATATATSESVEPSTVSTESIEEPQDNASPYESTESPESSPSPAPTHTHRRLPSIDHDAKAKKRMPIAAHAGPHRCDGINPHTGKPCNKVFSRPYDLVRHQDTIHAAVRKTFKCEACGENSKTFSRMDALSRHIRVKHNNL